MATNEQNSQPHHCHEFILTFNHLHGETDCFDCIALTNKPKKQLNAFSKPYEKTAKSMNSNAQEFQGGNFGEKTFEESKQISGEPIEGNNFNELYEGEYNDEEYADGGVEDFEANYGIEIGEANLALYSKYKSCECCHGMVFKCEGSVCKNLEACYCYMRDLQERIFVENNMKI